MSKQINLTSRHNKKSHVKWEDRKNKTQSKGKEESPERVLNEIQSRKLSDTEFKVVIIRMLKELSENHKEPERSYKEFTKNYTSMKKDIDTVNKSQGEMMSTIPEMKDKVERIEQNMKSVRWRTR